MPDRPVRGQPDLSKTHRLSAETVPLGATYVYACAGEGRKLPVARAPRRPQNAHRERSGTRDRGSGSVAGATSASSEEVQRTAPIVHHAHVPTYRLPRFALGPEELYSR